MATVPAESKRNNRDVMDEAEVNDLYQEVFGRNADPDGLSAYTGMRRGQVRKILMNSEEAERKGVTEETVTQNRIRMDVGESGRYLNVQDEDEVQKGHFFTLASGQKAGPRAYEAFKLDDGTQVYVKGDKQTSGLAGDLGVDKMVPNELYEAAGMVAPWVPVADEISAIVGGTKGLEKYNKGAKSLYGEKGAEFNKTFGDVATAVGAATGDAIIGLPVLTTANRLTSASAASSTNQNPDWGRVGQDVALDFLSAGLMDIVPTTIGKGSAAALLSGGREYVASGDASKALLAAAGSGAGSAAGSVIDGAAARQLAAGSIAAAAGYLVSDDPISAASAGLLAALSVRPKPVTAVEAGAATDAIVGDILKDVPAEDRAGMQLRLDSAAMDPAAMDPAAMDPAAMDSAGSGVTVGSVDAAPAAKVYFAKNMDGTTVPVTEDRARSLDAAGHTVFDAQKLPVTFSATGDAKPAAEGFWKRNAAYWLPAAILGGTTIAGAGIQYIAGEKQRKEDRRADREIQAEQDEADAESDAWAEKYFASMATAETATKPSGSYPSIWK